MTDAAHAISLIGLEPFRRVLDSLPEIEAGRIGQTGHERCRRRPTARPHMRPFMPAPCRPQGCLREIMKSRPRHCCRTRRSWPCGEPNPSPPCAPPTRCATGCPPTWPLARSSANRWRTPTGDWPRPGPCRVWRDRPWATGTISIRGPDGQAGRRPGADHGGQLAA